MNLISYRDVIFLFTLLFLFLTVQYWAGGNVIAPYRQISELALTDKNSDRRIENKKFGDFVHTFIPAITEHLDKDMRSGNLTLWSVNNALGHPVSHGSGFSIAYLPSYFLSILTENPWVFITALSLLTSYFAGFFIILFCREMGLTPLAGLVGGVCIATSPFFIYWLTFPIFLGTFCWGACSLLGVARLARKLDLAGWAILTFAVYSLLIVARKQTVIHHSYFLIGFILYFFVTKLKAGWFEAGSFIGLSLSALMLGGALTLPINIDIAYQAADSARLSAEMSFFSKVLPDLSSWSDILSFLVLSTTPELFGNPIDPRYPFPYNGLSITPLILFYLVISLSSFRKIWGWWLAVIIFCLFAFVPSLFELCVKYLGFNISRNNPLVSTMLPLTIIVAYGADSLVRRTTEGQLSKLVWFSFLTVITFMILGIGFGLHQGVQIQWGMFLLFLLLIWLLVSQHSKTRVTTLITALIIMMATISFPLMLRQDLSKIATGSPLVEKVQASLPLDSYFAVSVPGVSALPPNFNAELGLPSVHSYNSLSSKYFHTLIGALGGSVQTYGRRNWNIAPDYNSPMFWMANISLILSSKKHNHDNLKYLGVESGVHMHKVISRMGNSLQIFPAELPSYNGEFHCSDPRLLPNYTASKQLDQGDLLEYQVSQGAESILVISQVYHRDWQARVFVKSHWYPAETAVINGVFQGVYLPKSTQRVRLEFKPYARYMWISNLFWICLFILFGYKGCKYIMFKLWKR